VAPLLRAGELLIELLPEFSLDELGIHAVYASRRQQPAIMRRFLDFLAECFASPAFQDLDWRPPGGEHMNHGQALIDHNRAAWTARPAKCANGRARWKVQPLPPRAKAAGRCT
jgi:hypothetical protein